MPRSIIAGRYEIRREIGRGGMGVVYAAREIATKQPIAIKWLNEMSHEPDSPLLARFKREAEITNALSSPHIVKVREIGYDPEKKVSFIVMELLAGEDLQNLITRLGPLKPQTALRIVAQACAGLEVAHAAGVIHRDIKPANLFLAHSNREVTVKILDFGVAKIRPNPTSNNNSQPLQPSVNTTPGRVMGSPYYLSPEQLFAEQDIDHRCDIFGLGVTLYTCLVGKEPFSEMRSFVEYLITATTKEPAAIAVRAPWISPQIAAIAQRAQQIDKSQRFQTRVSPFY